MITLVEELQLQLQQARFQIEQAEKSLIRSETAWAREHIETAKRILAKVGGKVR